MRLALALQLATFDVVDAGSAASTEGDDASASSATKFDPRDLSFDAWGASYGLANDCSSWADGTGNGHDLNVASSTKPTFAAGASPGGLDAAQFIKASSTELHRTHTNIIGAAGAYTMFLVIRVDANTDSSTFFANSNLSIAPGGGVVIDELNSSGFKWNVLHVNAANQTDGAISTATWYVLILRRAASSAAKLSINGTETTLTDTTTNLNPGANAGLILGAWWNDTIAQNFSDCTIPEWGIKSAALSDPDYALLKTYLSTRHSITVA